MLGGDASLLLLDGATGHTLKQRGLSDSFADAALANLRRPELVTSVHREVTSLSSGPPPPSPLLLNPTHRHPSPHQTCAAPLVPPQFVAAGADVLTTNSFVITPFALARGRAPWDPPAAEGNDAMPRGEDLAPLLHAAARCANEAAASAGGDRTVLVAGCLPPLATCYEPKEVGLEDEMVATYRTLVAELAPRVDLFLAETLCCASEARAALQAAGAAGKPCMLSLTLRDLEDATLRGGETVGAALGSLAQRPAALLFNCCAPQSVTAALRAPSAGAAARAQGVRVGGYANGFRQTTSCWLAGGEGNFECVTCAAEYDAEDTITPAAYRAHAATWVDSGATVVGGCCGVGPEHVRELASLKGRSCT